MKKEILSIIHSSNLALINFKSSTCDPCQMIEQTLLEVKKTIGRRVEIHTFEINQLPLKSTNFKMILCRHWHFLQTVS